MNWWWPCVPFAGGRTRWEWYKYLNDPADTRTETEKWVAACRVKNLPPDQELLPPTRRPRTAGAPASGGDRAARPHSAPPVGVTDSAAGGSGAADAGGVAAAPIPAWDGVTVTAADGGAADGGGAEDGTESIIVVDWGLASFLCLGRVFGPNCYLFSLDFVHFLLRLSCEPLQSSCYFLAEFSVDCN